MSENHDPNNGMKSETESACEKSESKDVITNSSSKKKIEEEKIEEIANWTPKEESFEKKIKKKKPFLVSVEGNIGSGKSTLLHYFDQDEDTYLCPEPVSQWCDLKGHNLLEKLYEDPMRWSFQFQSYVQLTRLQILQEESDCSIKIIERSIQNNRYCFLELARKLGSLSNEELSVLDAWHDWLDSAMDLDLDLVVYLRTDPHVAYERMRLRNRKEESGAPFSYLQSLHEAYEDWLIKEKFGKLKAPILILDANHDLEGMKKVYQNLKETIRGENGIRPEMSGLIGYDPVKCTFTKYSVAKQ